MHAAWGHAAPSSLLKKGWELNRVRADVFSCRIGNRDGAPSLQKPTSTHRGSLHLEAQLGARKQNKQKQDQFSREERGLIRARAAFGNRTLGKQL